MKVTLGRSAELASERVPLVGVLLARDELQPKWLPSPLSQAIRPPIDAKDFTGRELETALAYDRSGTGGRQGRRVLLVGLGERAKIDADTLRRAAGAVARRARAIKVDRFALALGRLPLPAVDAGRAIGEGVVLGGYSFHGQKTDARPKPARLAIVHHDGRGPDARTFRSALESGRVLAEATAFARDLGNEPANFKSPTTLASAAVRMARGTRVRVRVLRKPELERRKFGGLLGVSRGSAEPPAFVELEWRPPSYKKTVCLVGKGLTFDSGGISLKPAASMEEMKFDMCGGAAVFGAFMALAQLKPRVRVHGLVPCSENMPGGRAIKPGDVLKSYGGITIEVINTDAEGRLILADALGRAQELEPDYTIDLATLTGACVVALGHRASGLFCASDDLTSRLRKAGDSAGEALWPLPLWDSYLDDMKSSVADVKNSGPRFGGAATAAAFLKKFAGDLVWAHLDIAGTAWDTPKSEIYEGGASGVGVRTLVRFIEGLQA